ncbi:MAG: nuclear transport factor 2 family protein [Alphaproteobacteria bacterium]|nr:nuclear transport factor 2 family protein [Alphaproteobacteria bacterium]
MGRNEQIVRDAYARCRSGDFEAKWDIVADDVTWTSSGASNRIATAGEWRGANGVYAYFTALFHEWQILAFDVVEMIGHDDRRFFARVALELCHNGTGARVKMEKVDALTMEDGKCTSFSETFDAAPVERAARVR